MNSNSSIQISSNTLGANTSTVLGQTFAGISASSNVNLSTTNQNLNSNQFGANVGEEINIASLDDEGWAKQPRMVGKTLSVPFVFGTVAFTLSKRDKEQLFDMDARATHRWTLYVRSPYGNDLSHVFRHVKFTLHETFTPPERYLPGPLFDVTELGWGEFEAMIELHFWDSTEKPIH